MLEEAIDVFRNSGIIEYEPFATLLINWREEIINSFTYVGDSRINNSHIESKNRMLERLMNNVNGFRNLIGRGIAYCIAQTEMKPTPYNWEKKRTQSDFRRFESSLKPQ